MAESKSSDAPVAVAPPVKIIDKIKEHQASGAGKPFVSFEYFPPRTDSGVTNLYARWERMAKQAPLYADVTWGAGGTTSDLTLDMCIQGRQTYGMEMNMHLTCTNMPAEKIDIALAGAKAAGISNIVALRGDPPAGTEKWEAVEGGFTCALDLVKHIRKEHGDFFCISVSGYPEGHPNTINKVEEGRTLSESEATRVVTLEDGQYVCSDEDYAKELAYLKAKVDAGADFIITQMFFDSAVFLRFCRDCQSAGINVPVIPGLMLVQAYGGFKRMTTFCKSRVPQAIWDRIDPIKDDDDAIKAAGVEIGAAMCRELIEGGVAGLHFYTLNLEKVTNGILSNLGLLADAASAVL